MTPDQPRDVPPDLGVWLINANDPRSGVTKYELKRRVVYLLERLHITELRLQKLERVVEAARESLSDHDVRLEDALRALDEEER